jgi:hypothetical protein
VHDILKDQRNVLDTRAQRGNVDPEHGETVVKRLEKLTLADLLEKIASGRRDDADIHIVRLRFAVRGWQCLEQLHLHFGGQDADLVEEYGSPHGERQRLRQYADVRIDGQCGAIYLHEGFRGPRTGEVDRTRHEFLAGSRFTAHQHIGGRGRRATHFIHEPQVGGAGAEHAIDVMSGGDFRAQLATLPAQQGALTLDVNQAQLGRGAIRQDVADRALARVKHQRPIEISAQMAQHGAIVRREWHAEVAAVLARGAREGVGDQVDRERLSGLHPCAGRAFEVVFIVRRGRALTNERERASAAVGGGLAHHRLARTKHVGEVRGDRGEKVVASGASEARCEQFESIYRVSHWVSPTL